MRYRFLCEVSGWLERKATDQHCVGDKLLQAGLKVFGSDWNRKINYNFITYSTESKSTDPTQMKFYNYSSLEDLLRICRNTLVHHRRLPRSIKVSVVLIYSIIYTLICIFFEIVLLSYVYFF